MKYIGTQIKLYKQVFKTEGWKGLSAKMGRPAAITLFLFFLVKGLVWIGVFFGAFELFNS